jgi:hypothetical protein
MAYLGKDCHKDTLTARFTARRKEREEGERERNNRNLDRGMSNK